VTGREPEERVRIPSLRQRWQDTTFVHWPFEPGVVQSLLPPELEVDVFGGAAWVSLTPFSVAASRAVFLPPVPGLSTFPETNLRTYVRGPDGRDGLWFLTLHADSLVTVSSARAALGVPYVWAAMSVDHSEGRVTYRSQQRGARHVGHTITVTRGTAPVDVGDSLAHWLTGRWRAWTKVAGRLATVPVQHQPWPLTDARVLDLDESLLMAAGLERPASDPVVHFATGVDAHLGWPQFVRARREPNPSTTATPTSRSR